MTTKVAADQPVASEALAYAVNGSRVVIFAENLELAESFMHDIVAIWDEDLVRKVIRTNGKQVIHFGSGGEIRFRSIRSPGRGWSCDRIYLPAKSASEGVMREIAPMVQTSADPAIVGYL